MENYVTVPEEMNKSEEVDSVQISANQAKTSGNYAKRPKRPPPCAFFVFMNDYRKTYKEEHPNSKCITARGKAGVEKWNSMSGAEKAIYEAKAEKLKEDYDKEMQAYSDYRNEKKANGEEIFDEEELSSEYDDDSDDDDDAYLYDDSTEQDDEDDNDNDNDNDEDEDDEDEDKDDSEYWNKIW